MAALQRLGMEPIDFGLIPDNRDSLQAALERAVDQADAVIRKPNLFRRGSKVAVFALHRRAESSCLLRRILLVMQNN